VLLATCNRVEVIFARELGHLPNPADREAAIRDEVINLRNNVGLIDVSTLGGLDVRGPDAAEFLNRITSTLSASMELRTIVPAFAKEIGELQSFDRLACGFVNDSGDYIEITGYPEDATWGLGAVIPVVGSGPGSVVLNSTAVLQRDLLHSHRFIEDMRLLEEGIMVDAAGRIPLGRHQWRPGSRG